MPQYKRKLPDILIPEGDKCYPLFIPDHPDYRNLMLRQLRLLTTQRIYERDDNKSALVVTQQWRERMLAPFLDAMEADDGCNSSNGDCLTIGATSRALRWFPNSPYEDPTPENISYLGIWSSFAREQAKAPQWLQNFIGDFGEDSVNFWGFGDGDVFISPPPERSDFVGSFQDLVNFAEDLWNFDFPYVEFDVIGNGELDIELLAIGNGGSALVVVDEFAPAQQIWQAIINQDLEFLSGLQIAELQRDLIQIPPETLATVTIPVTINGDNDTVTNVRVFFYPRFDDQLTQPVGVGGGLRSVTACGNLRFLVDGEEINQINKEFPTFKAEGVITMTTIDDICKGILCAVEEVSRRNLLGAVSNNFKDDVQLSKEDGGTITKIESDTFKTIPTTATQDQLAYGRAYGVGEGFRDLVTDTSLWYSNANISLAGMVERMLRLFKFSETAVGVADFTTTILYQAISSKIVDATDEVTPTVNPTSIANIVACNGANKQSLYQYTYDLELAGGQDAVDIATFYRALIDNLSNEQILEWYENGASNPRDGIETTPCYRIPVFDFVLDNDSLKDATQGFFLPKFLNPKSIGNTRRFSVEVSGLLTVTVAGTNGAQVGDTWDGFYRTRGNQAFYTPTDLYLVLANGSGAVDEDADPPQPDYSNSGYKVIMFADFTGQTSSMSFEGIRTFFHYRDVEWSGSLTYKFFDLGAL